MIFYKVNFNNKKSVEKVERITDNLTEIYISCNHMCYTFCYSFSINKSENNWIFSADCSIKDDYLKIELENCIVNNSDVQELFEILKNKRQNGKSLLEYIRDYKPPKVSNEFFALDETNYLFSFSYTDMTYDSANMRPDKEVEDFFYKLAKKYYKK